MTNICVVMQMSRPSKILKSVNSWSIEAVTIEPTLIASSSCTVTTKGYRHAAKQFFKGRQDFNPSNLADHPAKYPAVCQFHYDTQFNQYRARIHGLQAYRLQLNRLLADVDRAELAMVRLTAVVKNANQRIVSSNC
jgi:hypothetical protein